MLDTPVTQERVLVAGDVSRGPHVRCIRREAAIDDDPVVDGDAGCSRDLIVRCDADADHHDLGGVGFAGGIRDDEVIVALARAVGGGLADHGHTAVAIRLRHRLGQARGEHVPLHRRSAHEHGHRHVVLRQCGGDLRADVPAAHDDSTAARLRLGAQVPVVLDGAEVDDAVGCGQVELPRLRARRQQQVLVADRGGVCQRECLGARVDRRHGRPGPHVCAVLRSSAGLAVEQPSVVELRLAIQPQRLRQVGAVVGAVRFATEDRQGAVRVVLPDRLRRRGRRDSCADDHVVVRAVCTRACAVHDDPTPSEGVSVSFDNTGGRGHHPGERVWLRWACADGLVRGLARAAQPFALAAFHCSFSALRRS